MKIEFQWPARDLHPNARIIWQVKQLRVKEARTEAYWLTQVQPGDMLAYPGKMQICYTFYPPNKAHRDLDNMIANMKSALDGVMDALGTNDSQIVRVVGEWGKVVKGGAVVMEVEPVRVSELKY